MIYDGFDAVKQESTSAAWAPARAVVKRRPPATSLIESVLDLGL
jgi:hypothetical protein